MRLNYPSGLVEWIEGINRDTTTLHPILSKTFTTDYTDPRSNRTNSIKVELAFLFRAIDAGTIKSYVNTIETPDGGFHIDGLEESLLSAIYGKAELDLLEPIQTLSAILHVHHHDPQFESQTKIKLLNPEVKDVVADCVDELLAENPDIHAQLQGYFRI